MKNNLKKLLHFTLTFLNNNYFLITIFIIVSIISPIILSIIDWLINAKDGGDLNIPKYFHPAYLAIGFSLSLIICLIFKAYFYLSGNKFSPLINIDQRQLFSKKNQKSFF